MKRSSSPPFTVLNYRVPVVNPDAAGALPAGLEAPEAVKGANALVRGLPDRLFHPEDREGDPDSASAVSRSAFRTIFWN